MKNLTSFKKWPGKILAVFFVLHLAACGSGGRKERAELRTLLATGQIQKGIELINTSDFFKDQKQQLLKYLELGMVHHASGNYYQSVLYLQKAKEIHKKLFTVSISKKAATMLANDTVDNYYGAYYERSLIHFYLSLNHYLLYQTGKYESYIPEGGKEAIPEKVLNRQDQQTELFAARAEILDWDSFLNWLQNDRLGKSVFKNDLLAKAYGGFIHEAIGSRNDLQTALLLYRDAKKVLTRNYSGYLTFNKKAAKFKADFSKLPGLGEEKVEEMYIDRTGFYNELKDYLDYKILQLTKVLRPNEFNQMVSINKPSAKVLKQVEKVKGLANVTVLLQRGLIPQKIPSLQYYSLESALTPENPSDTQKQIAKIGAGVITIFAAQKLGLMPPPNTYSPLGWELGVRLGAAAGNHLAISFELPAMEGKPINENARVEVLDASGKVVATDDLPVINPLIDIAREAIAEDSASRYTRLGVRLATKHLTAILASYGTYNLMKNKSGEFFAKQAALLQYMGVSKGIAASEQADTRYWSTLPEDLRLVEFDLPKGKYSLRLILSKPNATGPASERTYNMGELNVVDTKARRLVNFRTY